MPGFLRTRDLPRTPRMPPGCQKSMCRRFRIPPAGNGWCQRGWDTTGLAVLLQIVDGEKDRAKVAGPDVKQQSRRSGV